MFAISSSRAAPRGSHEPSVKLNKVGKEIRDPLVGDEMLMETLRSVRPMGPLNKFSSMRLDVHEAVMAT